MIRPLLLCTALFLPLAAQAEGYESKTALGEALFFDANLSMNRTQACATCHDPAFGFADPRPGAPGRAVSVGDDGASLGGRNAPTASYARFAPLFHQREDGAWVGGQFLDGREPDLAGQAGGPPLNPVEMGMPDKAAVVARLAENPAYVAALKALFDVTPAQTEAAYKAMTQAVAAFENTDFFSPFDSKYDRWLRGEAKLSDQEELGRLLFFSEQFTNCNKCHQLHDTPMAALETFSSYEYHNIGTPDNPALRAATGATGADQGLLANPAVEDPAQAGKFKTPTLRNVAVTGPYMHNGVFADLETVVRFYNKYNSIAEKNQINPETGAPWGAPELDANLSMEELEHGPALNDQRVEALVAFLRTLTDARYEDLLQD